MSFDLPYKPQSGLSKLVRKEKAQKTYTKKYKLNNLLFFELRRNEYFQNKFILFRFI